MNDLDYLTPPPDSATQDYCRLHCLLHRALQATAQLYIERVGWWSQDWLGTVTNQWMEECEAVKMSPVSTQCQGSDMTALSYLQQWILSYTNHDNKKYTSNNFWRDGIIFAEALSNINNHWFHRIRLDVVSFRLNVEIQVLSVNTDDLL